MLKRINTRRRQQMEFGGRARFHNAPTLVVQQQMMVSTEQDAGVNIGASAVAFPVVNMVCFAPAWWALAARPSAPAVAGGERDSFACCE
jgi:hypothetical protein